MAARSPTLETSTNSDRPVRDPKRKRSLGQRLYLSFWKRFTFLGRPAVALLRLAEKWFGPRSVPAILTPVIWLDVARRLADYRDFKKLRAILPDDFWRGLTPWRHFVRMIHNWDSTLACAFLCDRLQGPSWNERVHVAGTPPNELPGSGERPVILTYLHTGCYGLIHYWLRARGLKATCFWGGTPAIFDPPWAVRIFDQADRVHGLGDIPRRFTPRQLREMRQFLAPGHLLTMAIDAESPTSAPFRVNGVEIVLSQGLIHLAEATNAILLPVSVLPRGIARFEIRFGTAVPDEMVSRRDPRPAAQFILEQLWKDVEDDPSLLTWSTLLAIDQRSKPNHIPWP